MSLMLLLIIPAFMLLCGLILFMYKDYYLFKALSIVGLIGMFSPAIIYTGDWFDNLEFPYVTGVVSVFLEAPDQSFYFINPGWNRIQHYSPERKFIKGWFVPKGKGVGVLLPGVTNDGNIVILRRLNKEILIYTPDGTLLSEPIPYDKTIKAPRVSHISNPYRYSYHTRPLNSSDLTESHLNISLIDSPKVKELSFSNRHSSTYIALMGHLGQPAIWLLLLLTGIAVPLYLKGYISW